MRGLWTLLAIACALGACGSSKKKRAPAAESGAVQVAGSRPSLDKASSDPEALVDAARTPHQVLLEAIGAHKLVLRSTMKIVGAATETLDEDHIIAIDGRGRFTMRHDNSREYGKDVIVTGEDLYIRPRYGKYVHRPAERGEPERLRDEAYGTLAAYLDVVGFALDIKNAEPTQHAGREAKKLTIGLAAVPRQVPTQPELHPERKWRETVTAKVIDGTVVLDAGTAAPVAANLKIDYAFTRDGSPVTVETTLTMDVTDVGKDPNITAPPPDAFVEVPVRARPMVERDQLLGKDGR